MYIYLCIYIHVKIFIYIYTFLILMTFIVLDNVFDVKDYLQDVLAISSTILIMIMYIESHIIY